MGDFISPDGFYHGTDVTKKYMGLYAGIWLLSSLLLTIIVKCLPPFFKFIWKGYGGMKSVVEGSMVAMIVGVGVLFRISQIILGLEGWDLAEKYRALKRLIMIAPVLALIGFIFTIRAFIALYPWRFQNAVDRQLYHHSHHVAPLRNFLVRGTAGIAGPVQVKSELDSDLQTLDNTDTQSIDGVVDGNLHDYWGSFDMVLLSHDAHPRHWLGSPTLLFSVRICARSLSPCVCVCVPVCVCVRVCVRACLSACLLWSTLHGTSTV